MSCWLLSCFWQSVFIHSDGVVCIVTAFKWRHAETESRFCCYFISRLHSACLFSWHHYWQWSSMHQLSTCWSRCKTKYRRLSLFASAFLYKWELKMFPSFHLCLSVSLFPACYLIDIMFMSLHFYFYRLICTFILWIISVDTADYEQGLSMWRPHRADSRRLYIELAADATWEAKAGERCTSSGCFLAAWSPGFSGYVGDEPGKPESWYVLNSGDSISKFQFQYDINTIFYKYCNIDINILK